MILPYIFVCNDCGKTKIYQLEEADYLRWQQGELIQNVFPEIEDREIMISRTCSECFDKLFPPEVEYA